MLAQVDRGGGERLAHQKRAAGERQRVPRPDLAHHVHLWATTVPLCRSTRASASTGVPPDYGRASQDSVSEGAGRAGSARSAERLRRATTNLLRDTSAVKRSWRPYPRQARLGGAFHL